MGLHRRHQEENQTCPIVDLDECEIKNDPTDIRVRLIGLQNPADSVRVDRLMDNGDIIVLCMNSFAGLSSDEESVIQGFRTKARSVGYSVLENGKVYVLAPNWINLKKV